jgi:CRISPR system Cascade subunit CasB
LEAAGHDLHRRADRLALIATALARCSHVHGQPAARAFGTPADRPPFSALRFNGLVRESDPDRLRRPLLRALGQVKGRVDVAALGQDLFHWGETVRTRWAFEYYGAGAAAPHQELESQE